MGTRGLPAVLVVLSLNAAPLVGLACAWACAHDAHAEMGAAGHTHDGAMSVPDVLVADQECRHDPGTVQLFGPSTERNASPRPAKAVVGAVGLLAALSLPVEQRHVGGWGPPDDKVLSPPHRSLVLRI